MDGVIVEKSGGKMYPLEYSAEQGGGYQEGISRRDWLAGMAMQGILSGDYPEEPEEGDKWLCSANHQQLARRAHMIADAMIEEGKK